MWQIESYLGLDFTFIHYVMKCRDILICVKPFLKIYIFTEYLITVDDTIFNSIQFNLFLSDHEGTEKVIIEYSYNSIHVLYCFEITPFG